ncbi:MAG: TnpV protein [Oscillospiraceae bacterium]
MEEIKQIYCKEDGKYYPEIIEEDGRTYKLDPKTFVYLPQLTLGLTPQEEELMAKPIGHYGRTWQTFMEENYPYEIMGLKGRLQWELIPRRIDKEAEEMAWNLEQEFARTNPRPTTFQEIAAWEKMKQLEVNHRVMTELVLVHRD